MNYLTYGNNYSFDQKELGEYYLGYSRLMDHWRKLFPDDIFELNYENLIEDPGKTSRDLIEYLGLDWDDSCLLFNENKRSVITASSTQVRNPIYKTSVEKWRKYEKHIQPLLDTLKGHIQ